MFSAEPVRNAHRTSLCAALGNFFKPGECFIIESHADTVDNGESEEERDLSMFLGASADQGVEMSMTAVLARLKYTDDELHMLKESGTDITWVEQHGERVIVLFTEYLWPLAEHFSAWMAQVKVVVCTADKMRKSFGSTPPWARGRDLGALCIDEVEQVSGTEFMTMTGHFKLVVTAGDKMQRVAHTRLQSTNMPCSDPARTASQEANTRAGQGDASSSSSSSSSSTAMVPFDTEASDLAHVVKKQRGGLHYHETYATTWLESHPCNVNLNNILRLSSSVLDLYAKFGCPERVTAG